MDNRNQNRSRAHNALRVGNVRPDIPKRNSPPTARSAVVGNASSRNSQQNRVTPPRTPASATNAAPRPQSQNRLQHPTQNQRRQAPVTQHPSQRHRAAPNRKTPSYAPSCAHSLPVEYYPLAGRKARVAAHKNDDMLPYLVLFVAALVSIVFSLSCYSGYVFASATGGTENDTAAEDYASNMIDVVPPVPESDYGTLPIE